MPSKDATEVCGRASCRVRQCGGKQTSMAKGPSRPHVFAGCMVLISVTALLTHASGAAAAAAVPRGTAQAAHSNQTWRAGYPPQKPPVYILPAPGTSNAQAAGSNQLQGRDPRLPTGRTPPSAAAVAAIATAAAASAASGSTAAARHRAAALRRGRAMYRLTAWLDNLLPGAAQAQPLGRGAAHAQQEAVGHALKSSDGGTQSLRESADGESPAAAADGWLEGPAPHRHMLADVAEGVPFPSSQPQPSLNDAYPSPALQASGNHASGPAPPVLSSFQTSVGNDDPTAAAAAAPAAAASTMGAPGMRVVLLPDGSPYPFNGTALTVNITALVAAVASNLLGPRGLPAVQAEAVEVRGTADRAVVLTFAATMPPAGAAAVAAAAAGMEGVKVSSCQSAGPVVMTVVVPAAVVDGSNEVHGSASAAAAAAFAAAALPHPAAAFNALNATRAGAEGGTGAAAASTHSTEVEVELQKVRRIRNPGGGRGGGRAILQHLINTLRTLQQHVNRASRAAARRAGRHGGNFTAAAAGNSTAATAGDNSTVVAAGNSTDGGRRPGGNSTAVSGNSTGGLPVHRPPRGIKPCADVFPLLPPTLPGTVVTTDAAAAAPVPAAPAAATGAAVPEPPLEVAPALDSLDSEPAQPQAETETETEAEAEAEAEAEGQAQGAEAEEPRMGQSSLAAMAAAGNMQQQKARQPPAHRSPAGASAKLARVRFSWQKRANGSINGAVASG